MFDITADIQPFSYFKRNSSEVIERLKATGNPMVLTINGKAELVVMDAAAYQEAQEERELEASVRDLQASIADVDAGRTRPMKEALEEICAKYGF